MRHIQIMLLLGMLCAFTTQATEDPCLPFTAEIPLSEIDSHLGFSGNDIIANFNNGFQNVLLTWEDGTVTSAHWEFVPAFDSAHIDSIDDNCGGPFSAIHVEGILSLKTDDGRIDARWEESDLSSSSLGLGSVSIRVDLAPQKLQGLPELLEGDDESTHIWLRASDDQLDGVISRGTQGDDNPVELDDGTIMPPPPGDDRVLAFMGNGRELIAWDKL